MGIKYLTSDDWAEFVKRFPDARAWIDARDLQREWEYLTTHYRNAWQDARLKELDAHFASIKELEQGRAKALAAADKWREEYEGRILGGGGLGRG